jgi:hypothetical protein
MNTSQIKAKFKYEILQFKTSQINDHILFERLLTMAEKLDMYTDPVEFVDNLIEQCDFERSNGKIIQGIALEAIIRTTVNDYFDSEILQKD